MRLRCSRYRFGDTRNGDRLVRRNPRRIRLALATDLAAGSVQFDAGLLIGLAAVARLPIREQTDPARRDVMPRALRGKIDILSSADVRGEPCAKHRIRGSRGDDPLWTG